MPELICHICGCQTDFCCEQCGKPVCADCCVPFTMHNQIDFALCELCNEGNTARSSLIYQHKEEIQEANDKKRRERNAAARRRYWKLENIEKRKEMREARKRARIEQRLKNAAEAFKIVSEIFK